MRTRIFLFVTVVALVLGIVASAAVAQNTVKTIAGGGPNNLPALKASIGNPDSIGWDGAGNLYLFDTYSKRVFEIDTTGNVTVVAGDGYWGYAGDGGPAITAEFEVDSGGATAVDKAGDIFIADVSNCLVREVSASTGKISTVAGTPPDSSGNRYCGYSGDGGAATSAELSYPYGVFVDSTGNIFIADTFNFVIREVSATTGNISTVVGNNTQGYSGDGGPATSAQLNYAYSVAVDGNGDIFVGDTGNRVIREVSAATGKISTVAGQNGMIGYSGDGGPATSAELGRFCTISVDASGNIFIADTDNLVIREVTAADGDINTVAGDNSLGLGYSGDGGPAINAQLNEPMGVAVDASGNIFIPDTYNGVVREVTAANGNISTVAGVSVPDPSGNGHMIGFCCYSGDGYPALQAEIDYPFEASLATDQAGDIFIADTGNNAIREISAKTGLVSTVAGNGLNGYSGDGGAATSAEMNYPLGVVLDSAGDILIADTNNCVIREVSAATGKISSIAGTPGTCGYVGDGGVATSAQLYYPAAVALDASGNMFIADGSNCVIREVAVATGKISTVAGTGGSCGYSGDGAAATSAELNNPQDVLIDSSGNIFISDTNNCAVREVTAADGNINTVVGEGQGNCGYSGDGGPATSAEIEEPYGLFFDYAGNLFVPDPDNSVVREVVPTPGSGPLVGTINTVAGNGMEGYTGDGGPALSAKFEFPSAAVGDAYGDLMVLDYFVVRMVADLAQTPPEAVPSSSALTFTVEPLGTASAAQKVTLSNPGTTATSVSTVALSGTNAADFSETDNCAGQVLAAAGGSCTISVTFKPSVAAAESGTLTVTDAAGTQTVSLAGSGIDFAVAAASGGSLTATVTQGQTATYSLQVNATDAASSSDQVTVAISCAGAPSEATCSAAPQSVVASAGTAGTLKVTVSTTAPTSSVVPGRVRAPRLPFPLALGFVLTLILWFCLNMRRLSSRGPRLAWAALSASLVLVIVLSACGGSSKPTLTGGTPVGNYTLTITGTAGSDTHTTQLTLTVNAGQ